MRARLPFWFGLGGMVLLALLGVYVATTYRTAVRLRDVVEAASTVVASSFEIERDAPEALGGSRASQQQSAYAGRELERALDVIDAGGDPVFSAESRWMRLQHESATRLSGIVAQRGLDESALLLGRLRVTLSELSDTAVMLHRIAHAARARAVSQLFVVEVGVIGVAIAVLGALIVLYQRYGAHREAAERQLQRANAALQAHADEKDQFLYAASHDLKEPLRMVSTYVDLLEREVKAAGLAKADRYFGFVRDGARRMKRLLDDLSAATMAERPAGAVEDLDLGAEARAIVDLFAEQLRQAGGAIEIGPLPRVRGDRARVAQILQNLVGNAIKYRDPARVLAIVVSGEQRSDESVVTVADNGQGIEAAHHQEIFRLFRRLHGADIEGTGAGLSICKRIVESWGGRIWVESTPGQGAKFSFSLPRTAR